MFDSTLTPERENIIRSLDGCPKSSDWVMTELVLDLNYRSIFDEPGGVRVTATFRWSEKDRKIIFSANLTREEWAGLV